MDCSFCGRRRSGVSLERLAQEADAPLREFCQIGDDRPVYEGDSDRVYYEQEGDPLENLLEEELGIPYEASEELAKVLIAADPAWLPDGEEPFFHDENNYHRSNASPRDYSQSWWHFADRIKHERRFFDDHGRKQLARILGEPGSRQTAELPVFTIGPDTSIEVILRARLVQSEAEANEVGENPACRLGPPPHGRAVAGRMNPVGIPVFYGALSEETAIAEVRPSVGSLVVVGGFRPIEKLRLLDLPQIATVLTGSIFASEYADRAARRAFLEGFHSLIARPVQPHDEPLEYIPTQAVAEYVANVLQFDGILYASVQVGPDTDSPDLRTGIPVRRFDEEYLRQCNVSLFGSASRVSGRAKESGDQGSAMREDGSLEIVAKTLHTRRVSSVTYTHEPWWGKGAGGW